MGFGGGTYADPWVFEGLLRGDPLGWVDGQHLVDQVLGFGGHRVPLRRWELQRQTERESDRQTDRPTDSQTSFTSYIGTPTCFEL